MTSSDDGGYVHDPSGFDADGERRGDDDGDVQSSSEEVGADPVHPSSVDREFDWRGWTLVGVIVLAFFVAPALIILMPPGGEGYRFALLIVPLVPAFLLAVTAVWATTRP
ncbi:hypothetical protein ACFQGT_06695 [Natrialbaceae archaeon GCM10025810]|uniref:hypothetical protein n=1 Tax=Halovalidus salilacus TaxID=3075124 RepID=UPI003609F0F0